MQIIKAIIEWWNRESFEFECDEDYSVQHDRVNEGLPPVDETLSNLCTAGLAEQGYEDEIMMIED